MSPVSKRMLPRQQVTFHLAPRKPGDPTTGEPGGPATLDGLAAWEKTEGGGAPIEVAADGLSMTVKGIPGEPLTPIRGTVKADADLDLDETRELSDTWEVILTSDEAEEAADLGMTADDPVAQEVVIPPTEARARR